MPATPGAPAASPETGTTVSIKLELRANNGLHAWLDASGDEVTLDLRRKGRLVSYEVMGEVTEAGLRAEFGRLGLIDVGFTPVETLSTTEPPRGCEGEPRTRREGTFTGTIEFNGELEYVRIEQSHAKGVMKVSPEWQCRRPRGSMRIEGTPQLFAQSSRAEEEPATLFAFSRRPLRLFLATAVRYRKRQGPSAFYCWKIENREGMKIGRVTFARAGASAFVFDHAAGVATVRPPSPFSGHATFKRRPHGRDLWRSTIRAPLLGAEPLRPRGPSFRATLRREYPFD